MNGFCALRVKITELESLNADSTFINDLKISYKSHCRHASFLRVLGRF